MQTKPRSTKKRVKSPKNKVAKQPQDKVAKYTSSTGYKEKKGKVKIKKCKMQKSKSNTYQETRKEARQETLTRGITRTESGTETGSDTTQTGTFRRHTMKGNTQNKCTDTDEPTRSR